MLGVIYRLAAAALLVEWWGRTARVRWATTINRKLLADVQAERRYQPVRRRQTTHVHVILHRNQIQHVTALHNVRAAGCTTAALPQVGVLARVQHGRFAAVAWTTEVNI